MGGIYGGILSLIAFGSTLVRGLIHGGGAETILQVAIIGLIFFGGIGYLLGRIAEWTVEDSLRSHLRAESDLSQKALADQR